MTTRRRLLLLLACFAVGLAVPVILGTSYSGRLSRHEGMYRVHVPDAAAPVAGLRRPRQTAVVVVDGLGYQEAQGMRSLALLAARGQCRKTDVGSLSLSRPVYAVLSTGLEADRTGARFNDDSSALAAESVWTIARAAGLSVSAVSEVDWWRELFPGGFDEYVLAGQAVDPFATSPRADVRLIHPLYVDAAGHYSGGASTDYADAVARVDAELERFLATLDLEQDLAIVTADHGHSLRGGHGGRQDRVAHVLTCHAGRGVRHDDAPGPLRSTTIAPSIALLLGLRFPADMRAGDDDLDALWSIVDEAAFPAGHLDERRAEVARFRAHNQAQLQAWLPASEGSWDRFYAWHRAAQLASAAPLAILAGLVLVAQAMAHRRGRAERSAAPFGAAFVGVFGLGVTALQVGLRGSFDLSSVAYREDFLVWTVVLAILATAGATLLHLLLRRSLRALLLDFAALSAIGTLLSLAHLTAFGWQIGFPVPPPPAYFFPYWAALFLGVFNGAGLLLVLVAAISSRRSRPS